ncbi:hypothetical protein RDI58_017083 [Solanum bulbocastanum]|uniref:Uncharacterized protein n=1 Tax=Solanum bulbocastanum TaxID=147425 RepID=A0AAN8T951_SOLBU
MAEDISEHLQQFILTEEEKEAVAIETSAIQSSMKDCEVSLFGLKSVSPLFDICNMWVQVWNIPLHWMSKDVGCKIGNALGGTCDVVIPENGSKEGRYETQGYDEYNQATT